MAGATPGAKKKLAILGGGASALTVAWQLTNAADWRERYEHITVYQMGWRLGGKGASGRGVGGRIEEHGLHIWMGWYQNAFAAMRSLYAELGRPEGAPLARWDDAFKRHGFICLGEQLGERWTHWPLDFPLTDDTPGQGGALPTLADMVQETLAALHELVRGRLLTVPPHEPDGSWWDRLEQGVANVLHFAHELADVVALELLLRLARHHAAAFGPQSTPEHHGAIAQLLQRARDRLVRHFERELEASDEGRRLLIMVDIGLTCVAGVLASGLEHRPHGLDALDGLDFREFLQQHGALPLTVDSALVRAFYDLLFAYRDGDPGDQKVAAGVALRFIFRMTLTYKGAVFWKMQAGMGDTIFTPLHQVLERRGVRFEFFHRVDRLELAADRRRVARIHIGRQATVREMPYRPYVDVGGLDCWPSEPRYEQLAEGAALQAAGVDLESMWTPWRARETPRVLEDGRDFDLVVFGLSIASIPYVAGELMQASERWRLTVERVETVRTQAVQLWFKPDAAGLGWALPSAVSDAYPEPLDTWADMSHLLPREGWAGADAPRQLTYFCAPMPGGVPALDDQDAPGREAGRVKANAIDWLQRWAGVIWPQAVRDGAFDWSLLVAPEGRQGEARFDAQFWRANIDPSERYVLSVPGSTAWRLKADERDFDNLVVTGDWTYSGVNAGCVEGTVISGLLSARAIEGRPALDEIVGWSMP